MNRSCENIESLTKCRIGFDKWSGLSDVFAYAVA